ncbi:predicted protein [Phaeodactylum tricornutum CCAP 1055/1]|uniref:Uncharacterized protein n=2 Tax=Phaeodactylum tricornutum TaxID=2850 RepID=B7G1S5_PHATC|nr:predicted protein [Phaeodactylum tricornutum CCAP 1055/1]EEC47735.1 predicted protein [Phaeodactylum tricornutum CCAP 1055/1]|eukprot:XP_002181083.1 predicted protein [Phaeodactylum tricornutum CCAP 1055/1]
MSSYGYSCNNNQNHLVQKGRTTSRVLAPPGGPTSFSLGVAPPPAPKAPVVKPAIAPGPENSSTTSSNSLPSVTNKASSVESTTESPAGVVKIQSYGSSTVAGPVSSNAFASGANMNGAQVMTGRPTSRVLAPPGGKTSWTLG